MRKNGFRNTFPREISMNFGSGVGGGRGGGRREGGGDNELVAISSSSISGGGFKAVSFVVE